MNKYMILNVKYITIGLLLIFFSCSEDFLEITPTSQLSAESVFADESGGDMFLYDIYNQLPDYEGGNAMLTHDSFENWSDNSVSKFKWVASWQESVSRDYGPYSLNWARFGYPALPFRYDKIFVNVRKCNLFIENVESHIDNYSLEWSTQRLAEARFLRAYFYHEAWMAYGGLPIITTTLDRITEEDKMFYPRATFEETFEFITAELEDCADDLPNEVGTGRATQGAALTLKGWCELFAHQYDLAAETNMRVIELGTYSLFSDYNAQFLEENNNNSESIFAFQHVAGNKSSTGTMLFAPHGYGWGCMLPTQNLVDDYRMANGLSITDPNSGYDPNQPYTNREERFYQSIIHDNGAAFAGKVYTQSELYNPNATRRTGYFRRKGLTEVNFSVGQDGKNTSFFRYAEVLLNYAEAKIELNQIDASVIDAIDQVRLRGDLPSLEETYSKSSFDQIELREIVRTERRIELAFECKRYWDLIRWRIAEDVLNSPLYGMKYEDGQYVKELVHSQKFDASKNYLFPLYQDWIDKNPVWLEQSTDEFNAGQNPGY